MFDNAADANSYLRNTICYWGPDPIYIDHVDEGFQAHYYLLPTSGDQMLSVGDVRDPMFNCRRFNIGYMNSATQSKVFHVTRIPARQMQQGLCDNNLRFVGAVDPFGGMYGVRRARKDPGFAAMLRGEYPELQQVKLMLADPKVKSMAVSPCLSLKRHPQFNNLHFLEYKGREISFSETLEFTLPTEFKYLREVCAPTGVLKAA